MAQYLLCIVLKLMIADISKAFGIFIMKYNIDIRYFMNKSLSHISQVEEIGRIKCTQVYKTVVHVFCAAEKTLRGTQSLP